MKKKLAITCMAGILCLGIGFGAYADSNLEQISAFLNHELHLKVNGSNWNSSSPPITYDGSTYLPLRATAEVLGTQVGYNDASKTVSLQGASSGGSGVSYYYTQAGEHPEKVVIDLIHNTKSTLNISVYSLTQPDIVQAIVDAKNRGIAVRVITDKIEAKTKAQADALSRIQAVGIPVKINQHSGLMHIKGASYDGKWLTTGSYNWTKAASTINDEVLAVDPNPAAAAKFEDQFERMWNDTEGFVNLQ